MRRDARAEDILLSQQPACTGRKAQMGGINEKYRLGILLQDGTDMILRGRARVHAMRKPPLLEAVNQARSEAVVAAQPVSDADNDQTLVRGGREAQVRPEQRRERAEAQSSVVSVVFRRHRAHRTFTRSERQPSAAGLVRLASTNSNRSWCAK